MFRITVKYVSQQRLLAILFGSPNQFQVFWVSPTARPKTFYGSIVYSTFLGRSRSFLSDLVLFDSVAISSAWFLKCSSRSHLSNPWVALTNVVVLGVESAMAAVTAVPNSV